MHHLSWVCQPSLTPEEEEKEYDEDEDVNQTNSFFKSTRL